MRPKPFGLRSAVLATLSELHSLTNPGAFVFVIALSIRALKLCFFFTLLLVYAVTRPEDSDPLVSGWGLVCEV
jgi:hypothetical protein